LNKNDETGKTTWEQNFPSKDNVSKEEKATARKLWSSVKDDPAKSETYAH
jgi:hypothetical protein